MTVELEALTDALDAEERRRARDARRAPRGFDPAAVFLLRLGWANLFEPIGGKPFWSRCKGCGAEVRFTKREKHHAQHKRAFANGGRVAYRDTASSLAGESRQDTTEGDGTMATATRTRSSSKSLGASPRTAQARKQREARAEASEKTAAPAAPKKTNGNGAAAPAKEKAAPAAAKKTTTAKKGSGGTSRAEAGKVVKLAAQVLGKKAMTAGELAKAVVAKHGSEVTGESDDKKVFNVAFAIRQAARKGETFKANNERPAKFSLK